MDLEIIDLVKKINNKSGKFVQGQNCVDHDVCDGKCCYCSNDVPKILVLYYIDHGLAKKDDFQISNTLLYRVKVNPKTKRCVFFNPKINGCILHSLKIKPPQCCIYPIKFKKEDHICKNNYSFKISPDKKAEIQDLFQRYMLLAFDEYRSLFSKEAITKRIQKTLPEQIKNMRPKEVHALEDDLEVLKMVKNSNGHLDLLDWCEETPCDFFYFNCPKICDSIQKRLLNFLERALPEFNKKNVFSGRYKLNRLREFANKPSIQNNE